MTRRRPSPEPEVIAQVTWEDPAPAKQAYDWPAIAEKLRANPMAWALIFERDRTSLVNAIRQGNVSAIRPRDGFEVRTRNNVREPHRTCSLYMRYNPEKVVT